MTQAANDLHTPSYYATAFTPAELDLLYELARQARNSLTCPEDKAEPGSKAAAVIALDNKLTTIFHKRRR